MLLKKLQLKNFLSHSDTSIDFKNKFALIISGRSGSGKSSLVEAIIFSLFGRGRTDNRFLVKRGKKMALVQLDIKNVESDIIYRISRSVDIKGKNKLEIHLKEKDKEWKPLLVSGVRDTQKYLEKNILHCSYTLFVNSVVSPQNSTESFIDQTAAERKNLLLQIINIEDLDEYLKRTKEKLIEFEQEKSKQESEIVIINRTIEENEKVASNLSSLEKKEKELNIKLTNTNSVLKEIIAQLATLELKIKQKQEKETAKNTLELAVLPALKAKIPIIESEIASLNNIDILKLQSEFADIDLSRTQLSQLKSAESKLNIWNEKILVILNEKPIDENFDVKIAQANNQIIELMKQPQTKCPQCNFTFPNEQKDKNIAYLTEELSKLNQAKESYQKAISEYELKITALGEKPIVETEKIKELESFIANKEHKKNDFNFLIGNRDLRLKTNQEKLESINQEIEVKIAELDKLIKEISILTNEIKSVETIQEQEKLLTEQKESVEKDLRETTDALSLAKLATEQVIEGHNKVKGLKDTTQELNTQIDGLQGLKTAFGPNGIKAVAIDYFIPKLEDKINEVLGKLSEFKVRIDTQKSSADGETTIEGLYLKVINEMGEEYDFNNFSGGERVKVAVSVSEGLASIQRFGFRAWDETIIGLDSEMLNSFGEIMLKLQENIDQIICISHLQEIKDLFNEQIEIKKVSGDSQIVE